MAGVDATDLQALAEEFLAACEEALDTIPGFDPDLDGAPARSFVAPGQPAADCCPQLTVHVASLLEAPTFGGLSEGTKARSGRINQVQLAMTLFRCADLTKAIPPQSELEAAGRQVNADGWALWNHLYNMLRAGTLFERCTGVFWEGMRSLPPEGGCVGWFSSVRVNTDGYEETFSS